MGGGWGEVHCAGCAGSRPQLGVAHRWWARPAPCAPMEQPCEGHKDGALLHRAAATQPSRPPPWPPQPQNFEAQREENHNPNPNPPWPPRPQDFEAQREEIKNRNSEEYNVLKIQLEGIIDELERHFEQVRGGEGGERGAAGSPLTGRAEQPGSKQGCEAWGASLPGVLAWVGRHRWVELPAELACLGSWCG